MIDPHQSASIGANRTACKHQTPAIYVPTRSSARIRAEQQGKMSDPTESVAPLNGVWLPGE